MLLCCLHALRVKLPAPHFSLEVEGRKEQSRSPGVPAWLSSSKEQFYGIGMPEKLFKFFCLFQFVILLLVSWINGRACVSVFTSRGWGPLSGVCRDCRE